FQAAADQLAERSRCFEHYCCAATRVRSAEHPGVVVIAEQKPLTIVGAAEFCDHVVDWTLFEIHRQFHVNFRFAGPDVISKWQASLPISWNVRSAEVFENRPSVLRVD